jgi:coenzyme F420-reducing hydrogenase delta subunit/Pyruvate/2-oxoacid:ferredoxin oxidoreductase delta subunit
MVTGLGEATNVVDMNGLLRRIRTEDVPARIALVMDLTGEQGRAISAQVFSAGELLATRFGADVTVYCNSVRVAATGMEALYRRARDAGVTVVKSERKPAICGDGTTVTVAADDPVAEVIVTREFDLLVVADLQARANGAGRVESIRYMRYGPEGALQYDDVWLLPGHSNRPGVFVVGGARGNSEYRDALTDGLAVANEIHDLLVAGEFDVADDAPAVDEDKCVLCLTCLRICPHGAISIDEEKEAAGVSAVSCQRCGICAAECPAQAITLPGFEDDEVVSRIGEHPRLTVFACENSAIPASETAAAEADLIRVPCAGEVDPRMVLRALEKGAEKVLILGCHPESCQYLHGSSRADRRIERIRSRLERVGVDGSRVMFGGIASVEPRKFVDYIEGRR